MAPIKFACTEEHSSLFNELITYSSQLKNNVSINVKKVSYLTIVSRFNWYFILFYNIHKRAARS